MPLYIDNVAIKYLNGPVSMSILEPNQDLHLQLKNTIILFGDTHNLARMKPCPEEDHTCFDLETTFMEVLNNFAKTHPVYFYFEAFLNHGFYEQSQKPNYIHRNMPQVGKSDMLYTIQRNRSCFYSKDSAVNRENCKYNNITWQYADIRQISDETMKYRNKHNKPHIHNGKYDMEYFLYKDSYFVYFSGAIGSFFDKAPLTERRWKNILMNVYDMFQDVIDENGNDLVKIEDLYDFYYMVFNDIPMFITKLLDSYSYKKQINKLSEEMKSIFTAESFVEYTEYSIIEEYRDFGKTHYLQLVEDKEKMEKVRRIVSSVILAFLRKDYVFLRELHGSDYLIELGVTTDVINSYIYSILETVYSVVLDIYFILRSYSTTHNTLNDSRLCLGYFGLYHCDNLKHYFLNIVKTHKLGFNDDNRERDIRRIHIEKHTTLNSIFLPGRKNIKRVNRVTMIGTKKYRRHITGSKLPKSRIRRSKSHKSKSNKSKSNKSKSHRSKSHRSKSHRSKSHKNYYSPLRLSSSSSSKKSK